jgi:hypothetical protein
VASPLASAGSFASKSKGFLKSISSRPATRRRFEPIFLSGSLAVFASHSEATISSFSLVANSFTIF